MPTIITAGDAVSAASSLTASNDGLLNFVVGPAGGKLTAVAIAADGKVAMLATKTNDNASAGQVGEFLTATAGAVSMTTAVVSNAQSMSLTAGDWEVWGAVDFAGTSVNVGMLAVDVSATTGGLGTPATTTQFFSMSYNTASVGPITMITLCRRFSLASTSTIYLTAYSNFGPGTLGVNSSILSARRIR